MTAADDDLVRTVAELAARVQRLEDELEITRVLTRYCFAVDVGDAEATARLYTEDTVIDLGPASEFQGADGARQLVLDERHQAIVGRSAHTIGPLVIDVDGDDATATGYVRVYVTDVATGDPQLWRLSYTRFELARSETSWRIAKRLSRPPGADDAVDVLRADL